MATSQIVISKLKRIEDKELFMDLTEKMISWLNRQPGFISYSIYQNGRNLSDILEFESDLDAKRINEAFTETEVCLKMHDLVESDYYGFFGEKVSLSA